MNNEHYTNPKIAIGIFIAILVVTFLYIRFFATYSSSTASAQPTPSAVFANDALIISPAEKSYSSFTSPEGGLFFEYPREWIMTQLSETNWQIIDSDSTESAKLNLTVTLSQTSSDAKTLLGCATDCDEVSISTIPVTRKKIENAENVTRSAAAVKDGKGYVLEASYPKSDGVIDEAILRVFDTITLE